MTVSLRADRGRLTIPRAIVQVVGLAVAFLLAELILFSIVGYVTGPLPVGRIVFSHVIPLMVTLVAVFIPGVRRWTWLLLIYVLAFVGSTFLTVGYFLPLP
jgi:hypothetical protein